MKTYEFMFLDVEEAVEHIAYDLSTRQIADVLTTGLVLVSVKEKEAKEKEMRNKKVLNEIATLYNQNSLGKAYYFNNADNDSFMECASACSTLTELLQNMGCKYNKEYTTKKLDSPYGEYWEMQIL